MSGNKKSGVCEHWTCEHVIIHSANFYMKERKKNWHFRRRYEIFIIDFRYRIYSIVENQKKIWAAVNAWVTFIRKKISFNFQWLRAFLPLEIMCYYRCFFFPSKSLLKLQFCLVLLCGPIVEYITSLNTNSNDMHAQAHEYRKDLKCDGCWCINDVK